MPSRTGDGSLAGRVRNPALASAILTPDAGAENHVARVDEALVDPPALEGSPGDMVGFSSLVV